MISLPMESLSNLSSTVCLHWLMDHFPHWLLLSMIVISAFFLCVLLLLILSILFLFTIWIYTRLVSRLISMNVSMYEHIERVPSPRLVQLGRRQIIVDLSTASPFSKLNKSYAKKSSPRIKSLPTIHSRPISEASSLYNTPPNSIHDPVQLLRPVSATEALRHRAQYERQASHVFKSPNSPVYPLLRRLSSLTHSTDFHDVRERQSPNDFYPEQQPKTSPIIDNTNTNAMTQTISD